MTTGVLVVDKPRGITSFDAVQAVGRILRERKCGHAGTLDPMATGVLPVCVGAATKIAGYLTEEEKEYEAAFAIGVATDTLRRRLAARRSCRRSRAALDEF